jgi:uncharacterized protein YutE (UPF0331/DUF86 family)
MDDINLTLVGRKVSDIHESRTLLLRYAEREDDDFLTDDNAVRAARYTFIVLVEASSSIAAHLCAKLLKKVPATYADSYLLLAEHGMMSSNLATSLAQMSRLRNLLVHGYAKVVSGKMV